MGHGINGAVAPSGEHAHAMEKVVLECLEQADFGAALERACDEHPEHADFMRRVAARLQDLGVDVVAPSVERIGPFELRERIGEGGMGVVYRAWQDPPGRDVALKVMRPELMFFESSRARFRREIEACARLSHPSIVPVYEVGTSDGVPWFSMGYVDGRTLAQIVSYVRDLTTEDGGPAVHQLSGAHLRGACTGVVVDRPSSSGSESGTDPFSGEWCDVVTWLVHSVALALQHAHTSGVLHRDVKPSNVMLTESGRAMLLDFGLALTDEGQRLTATNSMLGSLPYMPPEQLRGDVDVPSTSLDVYSLGVTLYELLTLRNPFLDATAEKTRRNVLAAEPASPRSVNSAISRDLETVCLTAMAELPARRYSSMAAFALDLIRARDGLPIEASQDTALERLARYYRRNRIFVLASACIVALLSVGIVISSSLYFRAERLRVLAVDARDNATTTAYRASISGAEESLRSHRVSRAWEHLRQAPSEHRGWEWRHLLARTDTSRACWDLKSFSTRCVDVGGDSVAIGVGSGVLVLDRATGRRTHRARSKATLAITVLANGGGVVWANRSDVKHLSFDTGEVREIRKGVVNAVASGPDSTRVATVDSKGILRVIDLGSPKTVWKASLRDKLRAVAWSPDGEWIAAGGDGSVVHVVAAADGKVRHRMRGHRGHITSLDFHPDSEIVASTSEDLTARLWNVESGRARGFPFQLDARPRGVRFVEPRGRELVTVAGEAIERWSVRQGLRLGGTHGHLGHVVGIGHATRDSMLTIGTDSTVRLWSEISAGVPVISAMPERVVDIAVSPDGSSVAVAYRGHAMRVYDPTARTLVHDGMPEELFSAVGVEYQRDGEWLIVARPEFAVVFDTSDWSVRSRFMIRGTKIAQVDVAPDGSRVALLVSQKDGYGVALIDTSTWKESARIELPDGKPRTLRFVDDGVVVSSGEEGFGLRVIDLATSESRVLSDSDGFLAVAVDDSGQLVAAGGAEGVEVFDVRTGIRVRALSSGPTAAVAFPADSRRLLTAGEDGALRVWFGEQEFARLSESRTPVQAIARDRDAGLIVTGDVLGEARAWRALSSRAASDRVEGVGSGR